MAINAVSSRPVPHFGAIVKIKPIQDETRQPHSKSEKRSAKPEPTPLDKLKATFSYLGLSNISLVNLSKDNLGISDNAIGKNNTYQIIQPDGVDKRTLNDGAKNLVDALKAHAKLTIVSTPDFSFIATAAHGALIKIFAERWNDSIPTLVQFCELLTSHPEDFAMKNECLQPGAPKLGEGGIRIYA